MSTPERPSAPAAGPAPSAPVLRLRPVQDQDASAVLDAFAAGTGPRDMARQGDVHDLDSAGAYVAWLRADDREATALVDAGDRLIGLVAITIDTAHRSGWFFFWLHPAHRGQGLMARAAAEVADRALRPAAAHGPRPPSVLRGSGARCGATPWGGGRPRTRGLILAAPARHPAISCLP